VSRPRVGAVTIGQTPRPGLLEALLQRLEGTADVIETGALDGMTLDDLPSGGSGVAEHIDGRAAAAPAYPLTTRMRDGSRVTLDESDLAPLVQRAIDEAEDAGADVTLLLCAGGFLDATARGVLVRPFDAAVARLGALAARRLAVVVPFAAQAEPARLKWAAAGFDPTPAVGDLASVVVRGDVAAVDAVVLDYVGHTTADVAKLRARIALPVVDLAESGADAVVAMISERLGAPAGGAR
jgi:protein AroM